MSSSSNLSLTAELRDGVLEGYRDVVEGRIVEFAGDLRSTLNTAKSKEDKDWS